MKLKYLVVGTGRCGTVYAARLLTSLGIPCGHESFFDWHGLDYANLKLNKVIPPENSQCSQSYFKDGFHYPIDKWIDDSFIQSESSYMAAPYIQDECLNDTKIIHIVRNPVRVVNSFINYLEYFQNPHPALWEPAKKYETFIFSHCSELFLNITQEERTALYVLRWNRMIEKLSENKEYYRHRVEDNIQGLVEFLSKEVNEYTFKDRRVNTLERPANQFTLNRLHPGWIKDEFIQMGCEYGYSMGVQSDDFLI